MIFNPAAVLNSLIQTFSNAPLAQKLTLRIEHQLGKQMPNQVNADSKRFFQIAWNVLESAVKLAGSTIDMTFWS